MREENRSIRVTAPPKGSRRVWCARLEAKPEDVLLGWLHDSVLAR
jgi:hypothetical protein